MAATAASWTGSRPVPKFISTGSVRPEGCQDCPDSPQGPMRECPVREPCPPKCCYPDMRRSNPTCEAPGTTATIWEHQSGGGLALLWHFRSMLRNSTVAVRATIRNRWWSEQLGDDGTADFRQRGLWRRPVGGQLFPPDPQPSGAGVADRQRRCRSSAHADADRSRTGPRSRQGRVLV